MTQNELKIDLWHRINRLDTQFHLLKKTDFKIQNQWKYKASPSVRNSVGEKRKSQMFSKTYAYK